MLVALLGLLSGLVTLVMATLGAVLLARFVLGRGRARLRIIVAALAGSLCLMLPGLMFMGLAFAPGGTAELSGSVLALVVLPAVVAWPIAYLATRRLDRLTGFDPKVFD